MDFKDGVLEFLKGVGRFLYFLTLFMFVLLFFASMWEFCANGDWRKFFYAIGYMLIFDGLLYLMIEVYPYFDAVRSELSSLEYRKLTEEEYNEAKKEIKRKQLDLLKSGTKDVFSLHFFVLLSFAMVSILIYSIVRLAQGEQGVGWLLFSLASIAGLLYVGLKKRN